MAQIVQPPGSSPTIHGVRAWRRSRSSRIICRVRSSSEITRRFAELGYAAICPNLHFREAPGARPDDAANRSAMANPQALDAFAEYARTQRNYHL